MARSSLLVFGGLVLVLAACGGDDDGGATAECSAGVKVGDTVSCTCSNSAAMGMQTCQEGGTLSACAPCSSTVGGTGGGAAGTSGTGTAGKGGQGGQGGAAGMSTVDEDSGTPPPVDDAGMDAGADAATDAGGGGTPGAQNGACLTTNPACDPGLACYQNNFCSKSCTTDSDCTSLTDATYTCSTNSNACRVVCTSDTDCPSGMTCQGAGAGGMRCMLP